MYPQISSSDRLAKIRVEGSNPFASSKFYSRKSSS